MKRLLSGLVSAFALALSLPAVATNLDAQSMAGSKPRVDGLLREWRGRMTQLNETVQGRPSKQLQAAGYVGYDDKYLYVAMKVNDAAIVRTGGAGAGEDHATLLLGFPSARGVVTHNVELYPGQPGKLPGVVKVGGRKVAGAKLVEAPEGQGFTFEAQIPWSAFPQAKRTRVGLRGALRYTDARAPGAVSGTVGTSRAGGGKSLPAMPLESEQALESNLIRAKRLASKPARAEVGNVAGDAMLEQVAVYGGYLTIVGPSYRGGQQFYFSDLGVSDASMVTRLELHDFDGDGRDEIVVQMRVGAPDQYRELLRVYKVGNNDEPFVAFTHEVGVKVGDTDIHNAVKIKKTGRRASIEIKQDKTEIDDEGYDQPKPGDYESTLLPWETVGSRTFEWKNDGIVKTDETKVEPKMDLPRSGGGGGGSHAAPAGPPKPPPPRPPSADELLDRVYALYRKDRKVGKHAPSFDFVTDVASDRTPERVLVHGKDVVVFGKGFKEGTSYTFITVGVADPKDIVAVDARDLTGDGKAEVLVRAVVRAQASEELGGVEVARYALLVYKVSEAGIRRIFGAETGRAVGDQRVLGAVSFQPKGNGVAIELRPARAIGWSEDSYPFPVDSGPAGGLEPLLVPWGGSAARRYVYDGTVYTGQ